MRQPNYKDRPLKIHGTNVWNGYHAERVIEFAKKFNLTGIIFHCNDITDRVIKPDKYLPPNVSLFSYNNRDGDTKNRKYYLGNVIGKITATGSEFYAEIKEIYYLHEILQESLYLRKENGAACLAEPFWWESLEEKIREFVQGSPEVSGIIISAGTRESMISLAANKCGCGRCRCCDMNLWHRKLITAMSKPLDAASKKLIVRDLSYTVDHQYTVVDTTKDISEKIIMTLKKTPHGYYPTFPDDSSVGNCGNLEQWIESDI